MKITVVPDKKSRILTEHRGEAIEWDVAILGRLTANENYDIYEHINAYWASRPEDYQLAVFNVYKEISEIFEVTFDASKLQEKLFKPVARLMELHKLEDVKFWTDFTPMIFVPSDLSEEFQQSSENKSTPERTYLRVDYQWLVALILSCRAMTPIWGAFVERTKDEVGVNFKEYAAFQLLAYSKGIWDSIPMQKLRAFTAQNIWPEKEKSSAIWGHVSSEDFPEWILSLVVVRRLSTVDLRGVITDNHPVKKMFGFVRHRAGTHETSFEGKISSKVFEGSRQDGENNLSVFEGYKNKQEHARGELMPFPHYASDPVRLAKRINPEIDMALLNESLATVRELPRMRFNRGQIRLMQYVLSQKDALRPKAIQYLPPSVKMDALAVTQALLWQKGHHLLAALVSATPDANYTADTLEPLSKQMLEELMELYPYINHPTPKPKSVKQSNAGSIAIDALTDLFSANDWRITLPDSWVAKVVGNRNNRRISVPRDIRTKIGEFVIQIARRSF